MSGREGKASSLRGWEADRYVTTRAGSPIENSLSVCLSVRPSFICFGQVAAPLTALCAVQCQVANSADHASLLSLNHSPLSSVRPSVRPLVRVPFSHEVNLNCISEFPHCHRRRRRREAEASGPAVILASREHCSLAAVILPHQMADAARSVRPSSSSSCSTTYSTSLSQSGPRLAGGQQASKRAGRSVWLRSAEGGQSRSVGQMQVWRVTNKLRVTA